MKKLNALMEAVALTERRRIPKTKLDRLDTWDRIKGNFADDRRWKTLPDVLVDVLHRFQWALPTVIGATEDRAKADKDPTGGMAATGFTSGGGVNILWKLEETPSGDLKMDRIATIPASGEVLKQSLLVRDDDQLVGVGGLKLYKLYNEKLEAAWRKSLSPEFLKKSRREALGEARRMPKTKASRLEVATWVAEILTDEMTHWAGDLWVAHKPVPKGTDRVEVEREYEHLEIWMALDFKAGDKIALEVMVKPSGEGYHDYAGHKRATIKLVLDVQSAAGRKQKVVWGTDELVVVAIDRVYPKFSAWMNKNFFVGRGGIEQAIRDSQADDY